MAPAPPGKLKTEKRELKTVNRRLKNCIFRFQISPVRA
jgi:hypothetical protein